MFTAPPEEDAVRILGVWAVVHIKFSEMPETKVIKVCSRLPKKEKPTTLKTKIPQPKIYI